MELKKIIESRVNGIYEDLMSFQNNIQEKTKEMETYRTQLVLKKKEIGEDGDPMEIKPLLTEAQKLFYESQLIDMNIKHMLSSLAEISVMAGLAEVDLNDLEIEKDALETMKEASSGAKSIFKSEGGKMVVADQTTYDFLMNAFNENVSKEENIKRSFENIQVQ